MNWKDLNAARFNGCHIGKFLMMPSNSIKNLSLWLVAISLLCANPDCAIAQNVSKQSSNKSGISTSTILDRLNQKLWVSLPDEYNGKVLDFVLNDTIMRTRSATAYTEEFIINEMKKDWWISKQNQLLFVWSKIYEWISQTKLYKLLDDADINRRSEYKKSLKQIANCYEGYEKWFKTYMETWIAEADRTSAEARQQSAEARQQSAEARQQSAEALNSSLKNLARFYNRYKKDPSSIKAEEVRQWKEKWRQVIQWCKDLWIDYKAKLLKEVWDKRKVDAILKFYGIE